MKMEALQIAKSLEIDLNKWRNIRDRIGCGIGFYQIQFIGHKVSSMDGDGFTYNITDSDTIRKFTEFVDKQIKDIELQIEKL